MRKNFGPKFWSQGTYLGCPRALGGTPGVVEKFQLVILFTYMMVYIPILFTSLGYFFRLSRASVEMWEVYSRDMPKKSVSESCMTFLRFFSTHTGTDIIMGQRRLSFF